MIITAILGTLAVAVGAITLHLMLDYAETKGYERGMKEAEETMKEVWHERL